MKPVNDGHADDRPAAWDEEVDVIVLGSGAGGLTAATVAAIHGAHVVLLEKSGLFGGGAATSGGVVWIPDNPAMVGIGMPDSSDAAERYLAEVVGNRARWDLLRVFLDAGPRMVAFMHEHTTVELVPRPVAPDYYSDVAGAASGGRMLDPAPYDGRRLGKMFGQLRPPLPTFLLFGGMMVNKSDIEALLKAGRSLKALCHAAKLVLTYVRDRLRYRRGTRLVLGNALAGRLLQSAIDSGVDLRREAEVVRLVTSDGRVVGVEVRQRDGTRTLRARRGVVLATGGFPGSVERMRAQIPYPDLHHSMAPAVNTGDGLALALKVGAVLDDINDDAAFWTPVSVMKKPDGSLSKFPHLITDRSKPGLVAINQAGRRFVNEAVSYHDFVVAMHREHAHTPAIPTYLVCDADFIRRYGLGLIRPGPGSLNRYVDAGYLVRGDCLDDLARQLVVPSRALAETVAANNAAAITGIDLDFGKGSTAYNRYLADPDHRPNPCLGPIARAPFFAVRVYPGDIGTSRGLRVDTGGLVLDGADTPIAGLYCCGNDMNSIMGGTYPSGGITLGPAMTFGYIIGAALGVIPSGR